MSFRILTVIPVFRNVLSAIGNGGFHVVHVVKFVSVTNIVTGPIVFPVAIIETRVCLPSGYAELVHIG